MKYSIVIPTYNHCDDLLRPCLESIFKNTNMDNVQLVVSANGCTDNTGQYLSELSQRFSEIGFSEHFKVVWSDEPLGYAEATNRGIRESVGQKIVLLNNDTVLLDQEKNYWLNLLESPFLLSSKCGVTGPVKQFSPEANREFIIFFCAMVDRKVFDKIGLLNLEYGQGGGEDIEFCIEAINAGFQIAECIPRFAYNGNLHIGSFPIYHAGEKTVLDETLTPGYRETYKKNQLKIAKKYNREHYKYLLTNNFERHINLLGEPVPPRESARYAWASKNLWTQKWPFNDDILELGCSTGFGTQFLPNEMKYIGVDYDKDSIEVAREQGWGSNREFVQADVNEFKFGYYGTIIAFEIIEHLDNGLELVEKLKRHCDHLLISVPYMEPPGLWGEHHRLHFLNETHFPGFEFSYIDADGDITEKLNPESPYSLMVCKFKRSTYNELRQYLNSDKVIIKNTYNGLGDALCHSTLPEIFKKMGKKVYFSTKQVYKNQDNERLFNMNPFIDGFTDEEHTVDVQEIMHFIDYGSEKENYISKIERMVTGQSYNTRPKIYYEPKFLPEWADKTFIDLKAATNKMVYMNANFMEYALANNENCVTSEEHPPKDIFEYIDIIHSCKKFITSFSGGYVMAATLNKKNAECYINKYLLEDTVRPKYQYYFDNVKFVVIDAPEEIV